ncbi:MAG: DsrE family protein [Candidatus Nanohaloarchaea archaeon]
MKTVFHLNLEETAKKSELLGNIQNLIEDETVEVDEIAALLNANAVDMVKEGSGARKFLEDFPEKVTFYACSNSLENRDISQDELIEGVKAVPSGVGKLNELQENGFNYIKI